MYSEAPWTKFYGEVPSTLSYPDCSIAEMVLKTSEQHPHNTAYSFLGKRTSFRDFASNIRLLARALRSRGISPGDRVMICMPNVPQAVECFYAVNLAGAVAVMVHPLSSEGEIEFIIKNSNCRAAFTLDQFRDNFSAAAAESKLEFVVVTGVEDALGFFKRTALTLKKAFESKNRCSSAFEIRWSDFLRGASNHFDCKVEFCADCPSVILYSGGTTGTSKGVLLSNRNFNAMALQTLAMSNCLKPGDKMLALLPIFHGFGLGVCIHMALICGCSLILVPRFNAESCARIIKKDRPNCIVGVPTLFEALIKCDVLKNADLSCLKGVFCGGDSLPPALKKSCDAFLLGHGSKVKIREGYGLTECVAPSCLTPYNCEREGSIGLPFPDTFYKIIGVGGEDELPAGETGEICISGPTVMIGYENRPGETSDALRTHLDGRVWLHTGDLGAMDLDGFIYFKQRIKRMIISSGYSIYPSQLESVIDAFPGVKISCVVGVPDAYRIRRPKAFVVLMDGTEPTEGFKNSLMAYCRKNIAKYALPKEIEFRDSLPLTKIGKVAYTVLEAETADIK